MDESKKLLAEHFDLEGMIVLSFKKCQTQWDSWSPTMCEFANSLINNWHLISETPRAFMVSEARRFIEVDDQDKKAKDALRKPQRQLLEAIIRLADTPKPVRAYVHKNGAAK